MGHAEARKIGQVSAPGGHPSHAKCRASENAGSRKHLARRPTPQTNREKQEDDRGKETVENERIVHQRRF
jgi:hypothetical protein